MTLARSGRNWRAFFIQLSGDLVPRWMKWTPSSNSPERAGLTDVFYSGQAFLVMPRLVLTSTAR